MRETFSIPLELFGGRDTDPAPPAMVRIASPDAHAEFGGGLVYHGGTFVVGQDGDVEPAEAGLYDEDTFGLLPRKDAGGVDIDACRNPSLAKRPQILRGGEIFLGAHVLNPWLRRFGADHVADVVGLESDEVEALLKGKLALVGDRHLSPPAELDGESSVAYGADALRRLALGRRRWLEGVSRLLPVLPAGLRPVNVQAGQVLVPDSTYLYQYVIDANETLASCIETGQGPRFLASAIAELQTRFETLLLDGLDGEGRPLDPGEAGTIRSLASMLTEENGKRACAELATANDFDAFVLALRGPLFVWRAALEASGLEIVPIGPDGALDTVGRATILRDRAVNRIDMVYEQLLGPPWHANVMHGPLSPDVPHIDVYTFSPGRQGAPALALTGGMSTQLMPTGPGIDVAELVCMIRPDVGAETAEALMKALLVLALFPFRHNTSLGPGHDVQIGGPLLPDSALVAWVLLPMEDGWIYRLSDALPRHPELLLAVAVTENELRFKLEQGSAALKDLLTAADALTLDPGRASVVQGLP